MICSVTPLLRITAGFHWTGSEDDAMHSWVVDLNNGGRRSMAVINPFHVRALCVREESRKD